MPDSSYSTSKTMKKYTLKFGHLLSGMPYTESYTDETRKKKEAFLKNIGISVLANSPTEAQVKAIDEFRKLLIAEGCEQERVNRDHLTFEITEINEQDLS